MSSAGHYTDNHFPGDDFPIDTTDHSEPDVPDLHPDQCARTGHTPARLIQTRIAVNDDGQGREHGRLYRCPCGEFEQMVLATGQEYPKYRTPTMEDI